MLTTFGTAILLKSNRCFSETEILAEMQTMLFEYVSNTFLLVETNSTIFDSIHSETSVLVNDPQA